MSIERVQRAAEIRGIFFNGRKEWQNSMVGYGYFCFTPSGCGFIQSNTLEGLYRGIMEYPKTSER